MIIQVLIIAAIAVLAVWLLLSPGSGKLATRRILLAAFAALAVLSVLIPEAWTRAASVLGVGRGTDLLLYALTVAFLGFVVTSFRRTRAMEGTLTKLARRQALAEAPHPHDRLRSDEDPLD